MIKLPLSDEELSVYRATARRRREGDREAEQARRDVAWAAARRAADLLRAQYNATRVIVFGSLAHGGWFTPWSDVGVNLVDVNTCTPELLVAIERDGIEL